MSETGPPNTPADEGATVKLPEQSLKRRTIESTMWTFGGYGFQQFLRFVSNTVLTYLLVPEYFGLMGFVNVLIQGLHMFTDLGEGANLIQSKRGDEIGFIHALWTFGIVRNLVIWVGACVLAYPASLFYDEPMIAAILPVAAFTSVIDSFHNGATGLWVRHLQLWRSTVMGVFTQLAAITTTLIWAYYTRSVWALVAGIYAHSITWVLLSYTMFKLPGMRFRWDPESWKEIFRFGKWIFVSSILGFLATKMDYLALPWLIGASGMAVLGVYYVANQIVFVFVKIVYLTSARVLFPAYSRLAERGTKSLRYNITRVRTGIMAVIFPCLCLLVVMGQEIIEIIYAEEFHDAGWMLQILGLWGIFLVLNYTVDSVTLAKGDSFRFMLIRGAKSILLTGCMVIGYKFWGEVGLVVGVAAAELLNYPVVAWAVHRHGAWMPKFDAAALLGAAALIGIGFLLKPYVDAPLETVIENLAEWKRSVKPAG